MNIVQIARVLKALRGLSNREIAARSGMSHSTLSGLLSGEKRIWVDEVESMAIAFDVPVSVFFERLDVAVAQVQASDDARLESVGSARKYYGTLVAAA